MRDIFLLVTSICLGWSHADDKIVGGLPVRDIRKTPYYVTLQFDVAFYEFFIWNSLCGGTIFTALYAISACHCVVEFKKIDGVETTVLLHPLHKWKLRAGSARVDRNEGHAQERDLIFLGYHPKCKKSLHQYDVSVVKVKTPFVINGYVKPVNIYSFDRQRFEFSLDLLVFSSVKFPDPPCIVTGVGSTASVSIEEGFDAETAKPSIVDLQIKSVEMYPMFEGKCLYKMWKAVKEVLPKETSDPFRFNKCDVILWRRRNRGCLVHTANWRLDFFSKQSAGLHGQICALSKNEEEGPCQGDSGSGLVCNGYLIGITSSGIGCANGIPDIFQNVLRMLDYIKNETCAVHSCMDAEHVHSGCYPGEKSGIIRKYCPNKNPYRELSARASKLNSSLCICLVVVFKFINRNTAE